MASYPVNKERKNYSRLCQAIVDLCTDILRDILSRKVQPIVLKKELIKCSDIQSAGFKPQDRVHINNAFTAGSYRDFDITLLYQILRIVYTQDLRDTLMANVDPVQIETAVQNCPALFSDQRTRLTPDEMVTVKHTENTKSYAHFKNGLLHKLHEHLCPNSSVIINPTKPWGVTPDQGAVTLGDDIERIRIMRNKVYGHITTTEVSDADFNKYWKSLEEIMERLDNHLSCHYKEALDKIRVSSLDLQAEEKYIDQIRKLSEGISDIERNVCKVESRLDTAMSEILSEATGIKGKVETLQENQERMSRDVGNLTTVVDTFKEKQEKITSDVTGLKTIVDTVKDKHNKMENNAAGLKDDIEKLKDKVKQSIEQTTSKQEEMEMVTATLETNVRQLENVVKDPVPEHLRRRYNLKIAEWESEDSVFIETRAYASVRNSITDNAFVTVVGNGGSGKSAIIHHLALEFKAKGFDILPVKDPSDIENYLQIDQKQLFVYDDPLGVHCINRDKFMKWLDFTIESSATTNMKVLCSIRRQIVNEPDFKSKNNVLNKTLIDIQDDENNLTLTEKVSMIRQHIKVKNIGLVVTEEGKKMFETQQELFPLACKLYVSSQEFHKANDWTFFQSPFKLVLEDLETMKLHDKVKYCVLILCLASDNHLDPGLYMPERSEETEKIKSFILACELTCQALIAEFQNAFESLLSVYLKLENGILSFSHDLISDVVAYHFGQKYPQLVISSLSSKFISRRVIVGDAEADDPYVIRLGTEYLKDLVQRMLIDLEKREFKYVLMNKCWSYDKCFETFKAILTRK